MDNEILHACEDFPRDTDFDYEETMGTTNAVAYPRDKVQVQNQGSITWAKMSCTRQGMGHIVNGQLINAGKDEQNQLAFTLWGEYIRQFPTAETQGATLQSSLDQFRARKMIAGYARVKTIEQAKQALDSGNYIFTGSRNGDWHSVRTTGVYATQDTRVVGHAFCIVGYNGSEFIALNSYGKSDGYFSIPFELFDTLFTKYSIMPIHNTRIREVIDQRREEEIKKAVDL